MGVSAICQFGIKVRLPQCGSCSLPNTRLPDRDRIKTPAAVMIFKGIKPRLGKHANIGH